MIDAVLVLLLLTFIVQNFWLSMVKLMHMRFEVSLSLIVVASFGIGWLAAGVIRLLRERAK